MTTIVEIPVINEEDAIETLTEPSPTEPPLTDIPALTEPEKKKPGRPVGSKSKIPGKPRAPRKVIACERAHALSEVAVEIIEPPLPDSRPIPTISHDSTSAMMLALLSEHARTRQTKKADLWKSWFH